jgi:Tol biopolymer transport system component
MKPRIASLIVTLLLAGLLPGCAFLSRASESSGGVQADLNSYTPVLSSDGHWLAFVSAASNMVPGDTNGFLDVFVRDNWTGTITRVDVSSAGAEADWGAGTLPMRGVAISDDGRIVAFASASSNLVGNATNGDYNVYWHDRDTDQDGIYDEPGAIATVLASARPDGTGANAGSDAPDLNADGTVLAFESPASDLLDAPDQDTNGWVDVYAATFDRATTQHTGTRVISRAPGSAVEANGASGAPSVDWSGNVIAFESDADNLLPTDTNGVRDVVVNDGTQLLRGTGTVEANEWNFAPAISSDGSRVAYLSAATNLVRGDTDQNLEVFVTEYRFTGFTESAGPHLGNAGGLLSISGDGARVAFTATDSLLVSGDTNGAYDVFVHDLPLGGTQRVSVDTALRQGAYDSVAPSLSGDGHFVAFITSSDLLPPDANGISGDAFVRGAVVPVIDSVSAIDPVTHAEAPAVLAPGTHELVIHGAAFELDIGIGLGAGVTASISARFPTELHVTVTVAPDAAAGVRDLVVNNRGTVGALAPGTFQLCHACVTIAAP